MNNIRQTREWMTTSEATNYLRVSTKTMARLIREGVVTTYSHPLDRRKKLVKISDIASLKDTADRLAA